MSRVLIIDDEEGIRCHVEHVLHSRGYSVQAARDGEEGVRLARSGTFDAVVCDLRMPGMSGLEVLQRLRQGGVDSSFIVLTAFGTIDTAVEAMKLGALDFLQKPFVSEELVLRVKAAVERRQLARQVKLLQHQIGRPDADKPRGPAPRSTLCDQMIGESPAIERARSLIRRAALMRGTALITGETGTGKELAARAIHEGGERAGRPFVAVNCAALSETLLESELFGHARGAFTDASTARAGLVEHAHTGTLFLDEIGTMPRGLQAKLLRTLESGEIRRLGENESRIVDVRWVAATNVDLRAAVAHGDFREDLYYRLNVLHVHLPPLRERAGDIPLLARHFLQRYGAANGVVDFTPDALSALVAHAFPGNVRELDHAVQRAVAVAPGPAITKDDLPDDLLAPPRAHAEEASIAAGRQLAERERVAAALAHHPDDLAAAARRLQISRTTLWRLIRKHRLAA